MVDWERYCNNLSINFVWGPPPSQLDPSTLVPWAWMEQPTLSTPGPGWPSPQAQAGRHLRALPADISKPKMKSVNLNMTFRELAVNWPQLSWRVTRGMFEGWRDMFCFSCCQGETPERPAGVFQVCVCVGGVFLFLYGLFCFGATSSGAQELLLDSALRNHSWRARDHMECQGLNLPCARQVPYWLRIKWN